MWLARLLELLRAWLTGRPLVATRLEITHGPITPITTTKEIAMAEALILTDEQKVTLTLKPKTAAGNPARVDGVPVWTVSNADILELLVADDGMSATVLTKGALGASQVGVVADADLGAGVREIAAVQDITVVAAEATVLGIEAGTPEPK